MQSQASPDRDVQRRRAPGIIPSDACEVTAVLGSITDAMVRWQFSKLSLYFISIELHCFYLSSFTH